MATVLDVASVIIQDNSFMRIFDQCLELFIREVISGLTLSWLSRHVGSMNLANVWIGYQIGEVFARTQDHP
jgi:hypothetical protein